MKLINHIIKEQSKYCILCERTHTIPTLALTETITHNQHTVTYPAIYDYCPYTEEWIPNVAYATSNRNELNKAVQLHS